MITHQVEVKCGRSINLRPFGDLQMGEAGFRKDLWNRWKKDAIDDKDSMLIGMGDYSDAFRQTVDHKIRHATLEDSSATMQLDDMMRSEMNGIAKELMPFRHRIIGLHEGHHFHTLMNGETTTQHLCALLKVKYLSFVAGIQIILKRGKNGGSRAVDIFSTHGCGGSSYMAADLQNLERKIMPFWDMDVFLRGHSTKVFCVNAHPLSTFTHGGNGEFRIDKKSRLLVNTGGFMDAYQEGKPSNYVERSNLPRSALGWAVVNFHLGVQEKKEGKTNYFRINGRTETE